jgi:stearoyl-CoA desaturase (delta-9 desaturase)
MMTAYKLMSHLSPLGQAERMPMTEISTAISPSRDNLAAVSPETYAEPYVDEFETAVPTTILVLHFLAVALPFMGLIAGIVLLWGHYCSWMYVAMMVGGYVLANGAITIGYHRLFTHRAFEASDWVKIPLIIFGSMSLQGSLFKWVAVHRKHHRHSDRHGDPHSPNLHGSGFVDMFKGWWHSHVGWIFKEEAADILSNTADLSESRAVNRAANLFGLWVFLGFLLPTVIAGCATHSWKGALLGFIWGGLARTFVGHHMTWSINSICHIWGTRPFRTPDLSRNNVIFGIFSFGEGWHNNHHAFPTSARHGLKWWQLDLSYIVIRFLEMIGLAWNLKLPAAAAQEVKRNG